jgi:carbamoyltransferase
LGALFSDRLVELLGPPRARDDELTQRHRDLARSVQAAYEDAFFHLLAALRERYDCDALAVAGGCAANSVANGKIPLRSGFRRSYVPPSTGDAGGAIGAALVAWFGLAEADGRRPDDTPFTGPRYDRATIDALLARSDLGGARVERVDDEGELCRRVAGAIADGRVVGWFQDRMEWGPRALGNRSILGDPRRADMKDVLNRKIKRRESFRPFAPSVLREAVPAWFEQDDEVPFMSKVFPIREERRTQVPAVTHVDGSGRLQTVTEADNPRYYRLISAFDGLTGVPMVLNTSFNENEPIVCRPEEALDCFLRTSMDVLVLGETLVARGA